MSNKKIIFCVSLSWIATLVVLSLIVGWFGSDPLAVDLNMRLSPPQWAYWLGTDELGRSLASRLLYGARVTLAITVCATILSLGLGATFGLVAGWYGRWVDYVVSGLIGLFWSVPFAIFAVLVLAIIGPGIVSITFVIAGVNWVSSARVFRAETLRLRDSAFVRSARALGFSSFDILWHQVLPNEWRVAIVLAGFGAAEALALESGLAFLGLSLPPPSPTWGGMMSDGLAYLSTGWWICVLPALVITVTLASFRGLVTLAADTRQ